MGQKVNPVGFRLVVNRDWRSKWYAEGEDYKEKLHEDLRVRKYLSGRLQFAALSKVVVERAWNSVRVTLHTSRPGLVIGRKGSEIERMTNDISKICGSAQVKIDIVEVRTPELDAQLVAENVAVQLERRISFRRAMKRALQTAMDFGAEGIRIRCAGRLGGADIARAEWYREGKVPLQTLRVPIDYGFAEAKTVYGVIGVKCWVNRKEENEKEGGNRGGRPPRRDDRRGGPGGRGPGGRGPGGPGGRGPGGGPGRGPGGPGGRGPGGPGRGPGGPGGPGRGPGGPGGPGRGPGGPGRGPGGPGGPGRGPGGPPGRGPGGPGANKPS